MSAAHSSAEAPADDRLVVASNRGPVAWRRTDGGELQARRGAGGLVTALGGALQQEAGTWVSVALSPGDVEMAREHAGKTVEVEIDEARYRLRLVDVGERFDAYYNEVANRLLWFTVHGLWAEPYEPIGIGWRGPWEQGYLPVNEQIGQAVAEAAAGGAEVHLHDYHLATAGRTVREAVPRAPLLTYLHTPWPGPDYLNRLPDPVAQAVLRGLLAADVVGVSSPLWARALRRCAEELLGAVREGETVMVDGERTVIADFVLGVDADDLAAAAADPAVRRARDELDAEADGRALVVRVDRTDLSKNILRGLRAYELLLERRPELADRVWHYAHLNPSRQDVDEYRAYLEACREQTARVQERFGEQALTLFVGDDYPRALAALQRSDVLLANPVADGTNLVAKEGPVLNERDGVVVLSRNAGAAQVLGEAALAVNPFDVEEQADALAIALAMDRDERAERAARLRSAARIGAPNEWFEAQRQLLRATIARRR